ncbi:hypothetical protein Dimus_027035 [Dionaea muscipula]
MKVRKASRSGTICGLLLRSVPFEIDEIVPLNDLSGAYETIEFNEIIPDEDDETASISQSIDEEEEGEDDFEDTTRG